jgi:hypothetical protein
LNGIQISLLRKLQSFVCFGGCHGGCTIGNRILLEQKPPLSLLLRFPPQPFLRFSFLSFNLLLQPHFSLPIISPP